MVRSFRWNGRKPYGTGTSRERHDHARRPSSDTAIASFARDAEPVFDVVRLADHVEAHLARPGGVTVARLLGELDAIVGQDRVDAVRNGFQQVFQDSQAVRRSALSTSWVTANLLVRSMPTKR